MKGTIEKARHVIVNRLEIPELSRNDHNTTFRCEASNTNLVPSVEMSTTVEMLREYFTTICQMQSHMKQIRYMSLSWQVYFLSMAKRLLSSAPLFRRNGT